MRWQRGQTADIEDRRAQGSTGGFSMGGLGGGGGLPIPIPAGLGGGGVLIVVLIFLALQFFGGGGSTGSSLDGLGGQTGVQPGTSVDLSNNGDMVEFMGAVADDANDLWTDTFQRSGQQYQRGGVEQLLDQGWGIRPGHVRPPSSHSRRLPRTRRRRRPAHRGAQPPDGRGRGRHRPARRRSARSCAHRRAGRDGATGSRRSA